MTNKEDFDDDSTYTIDDSRLAAFLAVHLVRKILDDACLIANATTDTDQSWCYQSVDKDTKQVVVDNEYHKDLSCNGATDMMKENKIEIVTNTVTTSTPQKDTGNLLKCNMERSLFGQGDEMLDMHDDEATNSTSMFINNLFDMSDVENVMNCTENIQSKTEDNEQLFEDIRNIMDSYINIAFTIVCDPACHQELGTIAAAESPSLGESEYSLLSDAIADNVIPDISMFIQDSEDAVVNICEVTHIVPTVEIAQIHDESGEGCLRMNDVARFESAYLSLNRDYEQNCEDHGHLIIEDTKGMTLQEVELLTADSSDENLSRHGEAELENKCEKSKELTAVSAVSAVSKKSIVSRCRSQGARLLACLRGWWRRRTPGQRKEHRVSGVDRGLCPLSPDARRRAASLVDQRLLRSPSPSRSVVWKFNTVNEAVVNTSRWKDYTFDEQPQDYGESLLKEA